MRLMELMTSDDGEEYSIVEDSVERELTAEFTIVRVEFTFVRGSKTTIEYHEFDGRLTTEATHPEQVRDGIHETERCGAPAERLCKVVDARPVRTAGVNKLDLLGESWDEVLPANVTHRHRVSSTEVEAVLPVTETVARREDTGEIIHRNTPHRDGDVEIRER